MNVLVLGKPISRKIVNNQVVDARGVPIVDTVGRGRDVAVKTAETDEDFKAQARCEELNYEFAEIVDSLQVGERALGLSMDPKERLMAYEDPKDNRLTDLGYRFGMAAFHIAYRVSEDEMLLWAVYIKETDKESLSKALSILFDHTIPPDTHSDEWLSHVHRSFVDKNEALRTGSDLIALHKKQIGSTEESYSVDEFLELYQKTIWDWFVRYDVPLSIANQTKRNNSVMKNFAMTILQNVKGLSSDARQKLMRVANLDKFDDASTRIMDKVIEYALQEELYTKLPDFMARKDAEKKAQQVIYRPADVVVSFVSSRNLDAGQLSYMQQVNLISRYQQDMLAAERMQSGITARRSSGGCAGTGGSLVDREVDGPISNSFANDIFAKLGTADTEKPVRMGKDGRGPLDFQCKNGCWNEREDGEDDIEYCKDCGVKVGCVPADEKDDSKKRDNVIWLFGGAKKKNGRPAKQAA